VTSALGIVQIFAWGISFYLLAVLADPIADQHSVDQPVCCLNNIACKHRQREYEQVPGNAALAHITPMLICRVF
jgi:hypothetical protein